MKKIISVIIILLVIVAIGLLEFSKTKVSDTKIVKEELTVLDTIPTNNSPKSVSTQDSLKINQTKTMVKPKTLTISDKKRIENKSKDYKKAIELVSPDGYINVDNITIKELIGKKVILVDFWTYSCVNCQRTLPFLTRWYDKYEGEGLEIIGVHTPEFKFEQDYNNVLRATQKWNVKYPVVQDNSYKTWQAYENRYWPRKYIIDIDGFIVYDHIGEGAYEETEKKIQELLKERAKVLNQKVDVSNSTVSSQKEELVYFVKAYGSTPELYAGHEFALSRGQNIGNSGGLIVNKINNYILPDKLDSNIIYIKGKWKSNADDLQSQGDSSILLDFTGQEVNIVAGSLSEKVKVFMYLNDSFIPKESAGKEVLFYGEKSFIIVEHSDLYNVFDGNRTSGVIRFEIESNNFYFNAFTFG